MLACFAAFLWTGLYPEKQGDDARYEGVYAALRCDSDCLPWGSVSFLEGCRHQYALMNYPLFGAEFYEVFTQVTFCTKILTNQGKAEYPSMGDALRTKLKSNKF